jgi:hypothetical protein
MKLITKPSEIVEMCVWDDYVYYCLDKDIDPNELLEEDKEFEISQKDALVCGILKVIETNNISHKFNEYVAHFLSVRSSKVNNTFMIRKNILIEHVLNFKKKFPSTYKPRISYKDEIERALGYADEFIENVNKLDITKITDKMGVHEFILTSGAKKQLNQYT